MVAWSTPGAAVLATAGLAGGFSMGEAIGAFMISALLITLAGVTGWFERVMNRIPMEIATAACWQACYLVCRRLRLPRRRCPWCC